MGPRTIISIARDNREMGGVEIFATVNLNRHVIDINRLSADYAEACAWITEL